MGSKKLKPLFMSVAKKLLFIGIVLCLLIGCNPTGKIQVTPTEFSTPSPSQTRTNTLPPYFTLIETKTPTPNHYTRTPTLIPFYDPNRAPAGMGPQNCPGYQFQGPAPDFDFQKMVSISDQGQEDLVMILDYLNNFGVEALKPHNEYGTFKFADLTNDGLDEIILYQGYHGMDIIGCQAGKYQIIYGVLFWGAWPGGVELIADVNHDGTNEIVINQGYASQGGHTYEVDEWDGREFRNIVEQRESSDNQWFGNLSVNATGRIEFKDLNGDGIQELILHQGIQLIGEVWYDFGPWRDATDTYSWNGSQYVFVNEEWSTPEYRFQATQDGDRLFKKGDYDKALGMYQLAITSPTLKWWGNAIREYNQTTEYMTPAEAALVPYPPEDKNAYAALSAYAYFRIMLLYLVQGHEAEARDVYNIIERRDMSAESYEAFGLLAQSFWDEYLNSKNLASPCQKAITFTTDHQTAILQYLGNMSNSNLGNGIFYGEQSLTYEPEDVCPVK